MQAELFYQFLDQVAKWKLGTFPGSAGSAGRPPKDPDAAPERPYPVVHSLKATESLCGHCERTCTETKTYSKIAGTDEWRCKCQDCGDSFKVKTEEMIKNNRFTIAKDQ